MIAREKSRGTERGSGGEKENGEEGLNIYQNIFHFTSSYGLFAA